MYQMQKASKAVSVPAASARGAVSAVRRGQQGK